MVLSTPAPYLSVVVPVLNGRAVLAQCLDALDASNLPRGEWEVIVVDDGSSDGTPAYARERADVVLEVPGGPRGPAAARNLGAERARGEVLVNVDADVCVHPDTLTRFAEIFRTRPDVCAVFGAYDDRPTVPGFLSQYRNLYHRYVHLRGAGEAETFWAGCGAVRRDVYLRVGGYDADRYPRPQIEDIDLGYRLRDEGCRILLEPSVQARHLKRWTLRGMVRTDIFDRGIPWFRLLRERAAEGRAVESLNVSALEKVKTGLVGLACLAPVLALALGDARWLWLLGAVAPVAALNYPLYAWFARRRGWGFALRVIPMNLLYYVINGVSVLLAVAGAGRRRP